MSETAPIEHPPGLTGGDFTEADEPLRLFAAWFADAKRSEPVNPEAMTLATVDAHGLPNSRMVLLKGFDERGFVFYTNSESIKGRELAVAQIGAWASKQSSALETRLAFEKAIARFTAKFAVGAVPRPPFWVGYRVAPQEIEFWQERAFRLHDRVAFNRAHPDAAWTKTRLYP